MAAVSDDLGSGFILYIPLLELLTKCCGKKRGGKDRKGFKNEIKFYLYLYIYLFSYSSMLESYLF